MATQTAAKAADANVMVIYTIHRVVLIAYKLAYRYNYLRLRNLSSSLRKHSFCASIARAEIPEPEVVIPVSKLKSYVGLCGRIGRINTVRYIYSYNTRIRI